MRYINSLTVDEYQEAHEAMSAIEAQETLSNMTISTWPHMKKTDREKLHKKLYKQAYPDTFKEGKKVNLADILRKV